MRKSPNTPDGVPVSPDAEGVLLRTPLADEPNPQVTILIPSLNERLTISETLEWCHAGFAAAGVRGEILIVDSSDDGTPELALVGGARVLQVPRRGLGRAYLDAIPFIRSQYVILGDADCTYDFREIGEFIEKLDEGYEFVMGSRFDGSIEPGAMPAHHRYFGTPATNAIFNMVFATKFSDVHCGMRALTLDAYKRLDLQAQGWEYASEMIIRAVKLRLKTTEVPIHFYKDRNGRVSNVKRGGLLESWRAGWRSLHVMFVGAPDFFLLRPGAVALVVGLVVSLILGWGPLSVGGFTLTLHTLALAVVVTVLGAFAFAMGLITRAVTDPWPDTARELARKVPYDRVVIASLALFLVGTALDVYFAFRFVSNDYAVTQALERSGHMAFLGLLMIVLGFVLFTTMLVIHAVANMRSRAQLAVAKATEGLAR